MKAFILFAGVSALLTASPIAAFPSKIRDLSPDEMMKFNEIAGQVTADLYAREERDSQPLKKRSDLYMGTKVENTGRYAWKAPRKGDLRGSCPGLNILANHGYISRTGYDTVPNIILASQKVFGMSLDLGTFLTVYSGIVAGDLLTLSIGGEPPQGLVGGLLSKVTDAVGPLILNGLLGDGLVGKAKGLDWSHYRFESDNSPTRADLYFTNDAASLNIDRFTSLYNRGQANPGKGGYDLSVTTPHRVEWVKHSIANNPYYWNGPFTGIFITTATYIFTYRFHGNYTTGTLDPYLSGEALKLWEGVTGEPGSFKFTYGSERIPDNFYRRPAISEYGLKDFFLDGTSVLLQHPEIYGIGGNTGKVNSFVGLNVTGLTGGLYNADTLLQGDNLMCLAFQMVSQATPDLARGLLKNALEAVTKLTNAVNPVFNMLDCPQLTQFDASFFDQYPGGRSAL